MLVLVVSLPLQVAGRGVPRASGPAARSPAYVLFLVGLLVRGRGAMPQLAAVQGRPAAGAGSWRAGSGATRATRTTSGTLRLVGTGGSSPSTGGGTWWTGVGPIVMTPLLIRVSGAGLLEKGHRHAPAGLRGVRRAGTSGLLPAAAEGAGLQEVVADEPGAGPVTESPRSRRVESRKRRHPAERSLASGAASAPAARIPRACRAAVELPSQASRVLA